MAKAEPASRKPASRTRPSSRSNQTRAAVAARRTRAAAEADTSRRTRPTPTAKAPAVSPARTTTSRRETVAHVAKAEPAKRRTDAERRKDESALVRWTAVEVPGVHVRLPVLRVRVPRPPVLGSAMWAAQTLRVYLPPRERMAYYGGLGLMAAIGVLDWPVALAAGAGVWVASHTGHSGHHRDGKATSADAERTRLEGRRRSTDGRVVRPGAGSRGSRARSEAAG
jgi:hypothetical protein